LYQRVEGNADVAAGAVHTILQSIERRIAAIAARTARLVDTAALYAALGGGWQGAAEANVAAEK